MQYFTTTEGITHSIHRKTIPKLLKMREDYVERKQDREHNLLLYQPRGKKAIRKGFFRLRVVGLCMNCLPPACRRIKQYKYIKIKLDTFGTTRYFCNFSKSTSLKPGNISLENLKVDLTIDA